MVTMVTQKNILFWVESYLVNLVWVLESMAQLKLDKDSWVMWLKPLYFKILMIFI